jgi:hypothetical protein
METTIATQPLLHNEGRRLTQEERKNLLINAYDRALATGWKLKRNGGAIPSMLISPEMAEAQRTSWFGGYYQGALDWIHGESVILPKEFYDKYMPQKFVKFSFCLCHSTVILIPRGVKRAAAIKLF